MRCGGGGGGGCAFYYLEASLIAPVREAIVPLARLGAGNPMGMYMLPSDAKLLPADPPPLPAGCQLRRLSIEDAQQVNSDSGMGPNRMADVGIGCWGVEMGGSRALVGWAVRGPDGAIGMLHVYGELRRRGLALAILHAISAELRAAGLPCFAFVRDDNAASRALFGRLGYARGGDVRWCQMRFVVKRPVRDEQVHV